MVAEAYDEARSLTEIELDLMVAAKVIRISDCTECEMDIHDSNEGYVQAAAHWRDVAEKSQILALKHFQPVLPMMPGTPSGTTTTTSAPAPPPCSPTWTGRAAR